MTPREMELQAENEALRRELARRPQTVVITPDNFAVDEFGKSIEVTRHYHMEVTNPDGQSWQFVGDCVATPTKDVEWTTVTQVDGTMHVIPLRVNEVEPE